QDETVMPWILADTYVGGTGCVNCARPGLWGSLSGNRGLYLEAAFTRYAAHRRIDKVCDKVHDKDKNTWKTP
ncbi:MAG: hypothetical protein WC340_13075, partial [Kiritimatiellia bacterium]